MKLMPHIVNFASDVDAYEIMKDLYNHQRALNGVQGLSYDTSITFEQKEKKAHNALMAEISAKAGVDATKFSAHELCTHPTYKWATFAVVSSVVDMIIPDTIIDSIGAYTEVRTGGFGDNFAFTVKPRDLFAVTVAGRGKRRSEVKKQFDGQVTLTPVEHDITVQASLYRVLSGQENIAEFAMKAARSIETQMTYDAYSAFATLAAALPTTPTDGELLVSGYTQTDAVSLAQRVTSWNQGQKAVFIGTQLAVQNILPAGSAYRYMLDSDYVKMGYIQTAFGFDVIVLPQVADYTTTFKNKLDDKKIYVMSPTAGKPIKLAIEGSTISIVDDAYANANLTQNATMKKSWVAGAVFSGVMGVIELA